MADVKLSLINQALTATGEDPVSELTGANTHTRAAVEHYDAIVDEELEKNQPKFAQTTAAPSLQTATSDEPMQYRWTLPASCLVVIAVFYLGGALHGDAYEIEGRTVRCVYNTGVTVKFVQRVDEELWTRQFRRVIVQRLEALFLRAVEEHTLAAERDKQAERNSAIARHRDAKQRINRPIAAGSIVGARFGLSRRR